MNRPTLGGHAGLHALLAASLFGALAPLGAVEAERPALAAACQACHGSDGISASDAIPNLAAQKKDYLVAQLMAFRGGERKNPFMSVIAGQLGDADIEALATYWSRLPGAAAIAVQPPANVAQVHSMLVFPARFPQGFTLYETRADDDDQVVLRYANEIALRAARDGTTLPAGALIVVANHAVKVDAAGQPVLDAAARHLPGALLSYAVMESRTGWGAQVPELLRNGDWAYALFDSAGQRRDATNEALCLACHKPRAADSYVFTLQALRAPAR